MRGARWAGLALLLASFAAQGAHAAGPATPEPFFFRVSPIQADGLPRLAATRYTIAITNAPVGNAPYARWYLHLPAGGSEATCTNALAPGGTRLDPTTFVWRNHRASFVWYHGATGTYATDRGYGCNLDALGAVRLTVVVENDSEHCTASYGGPAVGAEAPRGAQPLCELGGYLPLPVQHRLLSSYAGIEKQLDRLLTAGTTRGPAVTAALSSLLQAQETAFRLFPPVWGCGFANVFEQVVALQRALGTSSPAAGARAASSLAATLRACAASPARPVGVPPTTIRAVDRFAATVAEARTGTSATRAARLHALDGDLEGLLRTQFPAVYGMSYANLVDWVTAEAGAAGSASTAPAVATFASSAGRIGQRLRARAAEAVAAEKAA